MASLEVKPQAMEVEPDKPSASTKDASNNSEEETEKPRSASYFEVDKCKACNKRRKSIIQHLNKSEECSKSYSESDMEHLKLASKTRSKERRKFWVKKNIEKVTQQNAARYQRDKEKIAKHYQENKEEILKKQKVYYDRESSNIRARKDAYYQRNKEEIQKRRADKEKELQWKEFVDSWTFSTKNEKNKDYHAAIDGLLTHYIYGRENDLVEETRQKILEIGLELPECLKENYWDDYLWKENRKRSPIITNAFDELKEKNENCRSENLSEEVQEKLTYLEAQLLSLKKEFLQEFVTSIQEIEKAFYPLNTSMTKESFVQRRLVNLALVWNNMKSLQNFIVNELSNLQWYWKKSLQEITHSSPYGKQDVCKQSFSELHDKNMTKYRADKATYYDWHSKEQRRKTEEHHINSFARWKDEKLHQNCPFCNKFSFGQHISPETFYFYP